MNAVLYIDKSFRTFIEGDFSDESPTIPAIILNLVLGFSGVDVPMDVRDLAASIIKFDGTLKSWGRLGINIIALLPAIGTLKYFIDAFDAAKPIIKNSDEIADVVKGISKSGLGDDIVDIGKSVAKNSDETADIAKGIAESGLEDDIADTVKSAAKNADESTDIGKEIANESSDAAKVSDSSKNISKSSYKIVNGYEAKVNVGQQNKHIPGSNEHKISLNNGETKSIMYGNLDDIQKLLDDKAGTGKFINIGKNRERVDFGQVIGLYIDPETGISMETTVGTIHYGKKGAHIVPARPKQ
ncbi:MAG: hypothetical protein J1F64_02645 [Oscillospiraceae bacterium]|nr:hypothetical protein [Oscillospiraceae bacterium]